MSRTHTHAVVIFARDPVPGRVKTRLHPALDPAAVCGLYRGFLEDTLHLVESLPEVDRFIGVYPSHVSGFFDGLSTRGFRLFVQEGRDLGERMRQAFLDRFAEGYDRVVILGSDSPTLPRQYVELALASPKPLVLGPSTDGGYYLIGMREKLADVFDQVAWGTGGVLAATLEKTARMGLNLGVLPPWYDVDRPEDLQFLRAHLDLMAQGGLAGGEATRACLRPLNLDTTS